MDRKLIQILTGHTYIQQSSSSMTVNKTDELHDKTMKGSKIYKRFINSVNSFTSH